VIPTASPGTLFWKCSECRNLRAVTPVQSVTGRVLLCAACRSEFEKRQAEPPSRKPVYRRPPPVIARDRLGAGRCVGCGVPIEGREDKQHCSSACRQRAYRKRLEREAKA
jgi:hypothetical protein